MSRFAAQTMALAIAHFPPILLGDQAEALRAAAPALAPGRQLYFECRLAGADRTIDVSQHFFAHDDGPAALLAQAEARGWARLAAFARVWPELPGIAEIGLEHDAGVAMPAVFAAFETSVLADREACARFIELAVPEAAEAWARLLPALELAEQCGLTGGRMVGAMLSRDAQLRCMIRGLTGEGVRVFLDRIAWPGDRDALLDLLAEPVLAGPATRLVLGFTPDLAADCGIEVIHGYDEAGLARTRALFERLVALDLAEPEPVEALNAWPGTVTPADARADWPDALIARDLATGRRNAFKGFMNHVKLNFASGRALPAKAYLSLAPVDFGVDA